MTPLPPALVARLAQAHRDACDLMLETHRLRMDARAAGADELTLARLDAIQMAADTAWRLVYREHARHDPAEAAAQEEAARRLGVSALEDAREALVRELIGDDVDEALSRDMVRRIESGELTLHAAHSARAHELAAILRPQEPPRAR